MKRSLHFTVHQEWYIRDDIAMKFISINLRKPDKTGWAILNRDPNHPHREGNYIEYNNIEEAMLFKLHYPDLCNYIEIL